MWQTLRKEEVLRKLNTDEKQGLTEKEVRERQEKYGKNKLQEKKKELSNRLIDSNNMDQNIISELTEKDIKNLLAFENKD